MSNPAVRREVRAGSDQRSAHDQCWLAWPLQVQMSIGVPAAVLAPATSRHSPDCWPTIVPFDSTVHFWFAPPLHGHSWTFVPGAVWLLFASRHSVAPMVRSSPAEVGENSWLIAPPQAQICSAVPGKAVADLE